MLLIVPILGTISNIELFFEAFYFCCLFFPIFVLVLVDAMFFTQSGTNTILKPEVTFVNCFMTVPTVQKLRRYHDLSRTT